MAIDREWRSLKEEIPDGISPKTEQGRALITEYVRMGQWKRWWRCEDKWPIFCRTLDRWRDARREDEDGGEPAFKRGRRTGGNDAEQAPLGDKVSAEEEEESCELIVLDIPDHALDIVESRAGGIAERCQHLDKDIEARCVEEIFACCPRCLVPLCGLHLSGNSVSACHEHNPHVPCGCAHCVFGWEMPPIGQRVPLPPIRNIRS
jgi:hypothetical protein